MRPPDRDRAQQLENGLLAFSRNTRRLPGIRARARRLAFVEQLLESIRRVQYVSVVRSRQVSAGRADPNDELFDPLLAAILYQNQGLFDEAFWLVFLFVHFGKHARSGWLYAREIYGALGSGARWDWARTSSNPSEFRQWLAAHQEELKPKGVPHGFGNHRKYESLDAHSARGTGAVVESYVRWVGPPRTHQELMKTACDQAAGDPRKAFDLLYHSMDTVVSFGRTARFDYLAMIGKLGLAPIEPGSAYVHSSTGPLRGARLLFGGNNTAPLSGADLDAWLVELGNELGVGMQVLEDALCNWQKSPEKFKPFRG